MDKYPKAEVDDFIQYLRLPFGANKFTGGPNLSWGGRVPVRSRAVHQNEASWSVLVLLNGRVLAENDEGGKSVNLAQRERAVEQLQGLAVMSLSRNPGSQVQKAHRDHIVGQNMQAFPVYPYGRTCWRTKRIFITFKFYLTNSIFLWCSTGPSALAPDKNNETNIIISIIQSNAVT